MRQICPQFESGCRLFLTAAPRPPLPRFVGSEAPVWAGLGQKKIPGVFDSAKDILPVAHDDPQTLLSIYS